MKSFSSRPFERQVADQIYDTATSLRRHERLVRATADRTAGWARFRDAAAARIAAGAIRSADVRRLDRLLEDFTARFEHTGGIVHWAADAAGARDILGTVLREAGAKSAVRGHSATLDEIGADDAIGRAGAVVTQTAFGDRLSALAGDAPSHPVYPAAHLSREEAAALLHRSGGESLCRTPEEMAGAVRTRLRPQFLGADAGVLGVNFLLADSGHAVWVESEGNLRLCAVLPRTLVLVAGIDKVTSAAENLPILLATLAAAAGGRTLSPAVTLLRPDQGAARGRKVHLILVDNGRSQRLASPALAETLRCIGCGACSDVCPVYRLAGGSAFGMRRPGPYGLATEIGAHDPGVRRQLAMATPLCGACTEVCPVRIDLHSALVAARAVTGSRLPGLRLRLLLAAYLWSVRSHARFVFGAATFRKLVTLLDVIRDTPFNPIEAWSRFRTLPEMPPRTFRRWWKETGGIQPPPPANKP